MKLWVHLSKLLLVFAISMSLMAIGFAHKLGSPAPQTPEFAQFIALGGSLDDLCGTGGSDGKATSRGCEACRIADHLTVSGHSYTVSTPCFRTFVQTFVAKRLAQTRPLDRARLTRAPPSLIS